MDLIEALAKATAPRHLKGSGATATAPIIMRVGSRPASKVREWSDADAVKDGYKGNVWVRAALGRLATAAARVPLIANVRIGGEWVPSEEASGKAGTAVRELAERLEMPNPKMDRAGFVGRAIITQNLTGNFLAFKAGRGGKEAIGPRDPVAAIWPLISGFRPVRDDTGYAEAYENKVITQGRKKYPAAEVLHWMFEDPEDSAWGCPPLQAAAAVVDADNEAMRWNAEAMMRRAVKDMLLSSGGTFPSPEQYDFTRQLLNEQMQGPNTARGAGLLPGDWRVLDLDRSPVEMDFIESQKLSIQKVAAVFGVPIPLLSTEVQTYSNYQNAMRDLWMNAVIPWLDAFVGVLNRDLVPHYGDRSKLWVTYDLSNVEALREDQHKKAQTLALMLDKGVPYNVAIDFLELDLPPIEGAGDVPHGVSLGKLAIDSRATALPAGEGGEAEPEPEPAAVLEAPAEDVAQTALNGAQVQALRELVQSVVAQELPAEAAIALILVAFPTVPEDVARRIVESAAAFVVEKPQPALPPAPIDVEATRINGRRSRSVAAGKGPSARKAALLEELAPLWTLADRTGDLVAAAFRRIAGEFRERVNLDQVRAALASGDAAAVAQAVGVERMRVDLAALVPVVGGGARVAVDLARQQLSTRAGRDIVVDGALAGRFASSATDRAVDFIASSSARGVAEALATLRGTEATAVALPKMAELFGIMALLNGQQATQAAKFLVDLLAGGAALDSALTKVERLAERALVERAIGIGGDLGPRAAWGGQRAAFDHARETSQVREIRRIWADSDDGDVCPECISLDEQTVGGDELYVSPISGNSYYGPPDPHPKSCRCGEGMAEVVV